uniref:DUF433 domain-containing protein n=1 Tax=Schlesneria paludicola TaxID=360056 RepID=A0A7C2P3B2_9PLAN
MNTSLQTEFREKFMRQFPDAKDCSDESAIEFNRLLESRLGIESESDEVIQQENTFVENSAPVMLRRYEECDSWVRSERHLWRWGRYVYLRLFLRIGSMERAVGRINPSDEAQNRERAFQAMQDQLNSWGQCAYFCIQPESEDVGAVELYGLFLVDPLALNLIIPDEHGRATVRDTRFRVSQLVQLWQWLKVDPEQLRSDLYDQLSPQQLHAAFAYWHSHRETIDQEIQEEQALAEAHRRRQPVVQGQ